jgi:hypothetical protein
LGGEVFSGLDGAFAGTLASGEQFTRRAPGECLETIAVNISCAVRSCSRAPALTAQPFAINEMGAPRRGGGGFVTRLPELWRGRPCLADALGSRSSPLGSVGLEDEVELVA